MQCHAISYWIDTIRLRTILTLANHQHFKKYQYDTSVQAVSYTHLTLPTIYPV